MPLCGIFFSKPDKNFGIMDTYLKTTQKLDRKKRCCQTAERKNNKINKKKE